MDTIKIEKGIKIAGSYCERLSVLPTLRNLKVGDSFLYPALKRSSLAQAAGKLGIKIVTRKASETEVRVWRVK